MVRGTHPTELSRLNWVAPLFIGCQPHRAIFFEQIPNPILQCLGGAQSYDFFRLRQTGQKLQDIGGACKLGLGDGIQFP